jgi:hypothetical protein
MFDTGRAGTEGSMACSEQCCSARGRRDRQNAHWGDVSGHGPVVVAASIAPAAGAISAPEFTVGLGIGDTDILDFGGSSGIIGPDRPVLVASSSAAGGFEPP